MPTYEPRENNAAGFETVFVPNDVNEQIAAESLLQEAGIPFDSKTDSLQDLYGAKQLSDPVEIRVPMEHAEEARELLEPNLVLENAEIVGEVPAELALPAIPEDPMIAKARRYSIISVLCSVIFGSFLSVFGLIFGVRALAITREGIPILWRVFGWVGAVFGFLGTCYWIGLFWILQSAAG